MPSLINLANSNGAIVGEDVARAQEPEMQKALDKYNKTSFDSLIKQVQAEYWLAWQHQNPKIQKDLGRLKVYNNQKLDQDLVSDPLLFGIFQTVFAGLYNDRMTTVWDGNDEGDEDTADNLMALSKYDYKKMQKAQLDFSWIWDACWNGRGIINLEEFNRDPKFMCPIPYSIDSTNFLRDPRAVSVNGDVMGNAAMRFGGYEIGMTKWQMKDNGNFINTEYLKNSTDTKSLLLQSIQAKSDAQGMQQLFNGQGLQVPINLYGNTEYNVLVWWTIWKGKKVKVWLANNKVLIVRLKELGATTKRWTLMDRPLYPTAHSWEGVSIPDLVEDKQRQRSVAINLALKVLKADLYPSYVYNEKMIKNPNDLRKINEQNKFIAVKGDTTDVRAALQPTTKFTVDKQLLGFILDSLDTSAQRANASPDMQQGQVNNQQRTLGELNLVSAGVNTRRGLSAKIFGWSEEDFWQQWYLGYKENFNDHIDEKVIRLKGAFGNKWRKLTKDQIVATVDPDVTIESESESEAQKTKDRLLLTNYGQLIIQDPTINKRYLERKLGRLNGLENDELERLFPPTVDELEAERENDLINEDKLPQIHANQNHIVHWEIHSKAAETDAKKAHMEAHFQAMLLQKAQPELFPSAQQTGQPIGNGTSNISQAAPGQPGQPALPNLSALANTLKSPPSNFANA